MSYDLYEPAMDKGTKVINSKDQAEKVNPEINLNEHQGQGKPAESIAFEMKNTDETLWLKAYTGVCGGAVALTRVAPGYFRFTKSNGQKMESQGDRELEALFDRLKENL